MANYLRGQIAKMADLNMETLRFYEKNGLIPVPIRSESGYRLYPEELLIRLEFIKNAKYCGFTLKQIKNFFTKVENKMADKSSFIDGLDSRMREIDRKIAQLEKIKGVLIDLKSNLLDADKRLEVKSILHILGIEEID
ncbi:MAG: hypothetical protein JWM44_4033 [Bacilli bacterium]|nr:hypothetical protein [Bacilli bacterium]